MKLFYFQKCSQRKLQKVRLKRISLQVDNFFQELPSIHLLVTQINKWGFSKKRLLRLNRYGILNILLTQKQTRTKSKAQTKLRTKEDLLLGQINFSFSYDQISQVILLDSQTFQLNYTNRGSTIYRHDYAIPLAQEITCRCEVWNSRYMSLVQFTKTTVLSLLFTNYSQNQQNQKIETNKNKNEYSKKGGSIINKKENKLQAEIMNENTENVTKMKKDFSSLNDQWFEVSVLEKNVEEILSKSNTKQRTQISTKKKNLQTTTNCNGNGNGNKNRNRIAPKTKNENKQNQNQNSQQKTENSQDQDNKTKNEKLSNSVQDTNLKNEKKNFQEETEGEKKKTENFKIRKEKKNQIRNQQENSNQEKKNQELKNKHCKGNNLLNKKNIESNLNFERHFKIFKFFSCTYAIAFERGSINGFMIKSIVDQIIFNQQNQIYDKIDYFFANFSKICSQKDLLFKNINNFLRALRIKILLKYEKTLNILPTIDHTQEEIIKFIRNVVEKRTERVVILPIYKKLFDFLRKINKKEQALIDMGIINNSKHFSQRGAGIVQELISVSRWKIPICHLKKLNYAILPSEQLKIISETGDLIIETVKDEGLNRKLLNADNFIYIFYYILIKSHVSSLESRINIIENLSPEKQLNVKDGFYFTSVCAAVSLIKEQFLVKKDIVQNSNNIKSDINHKYPEQKLKQDKDGKKEKR
ncbi:hypothetical protein M0813_17771 [Anaeramoeba flamelloides]|uniref:VPS9 domain-containing protein n=1 Tax=Anaeramoeba flamelloides TaxID=1746091 RepID=A0ABQ8YUP3_9EUKA|nr:hypothetical protein M0813_17771 [Anaeramoeba flamelloides]